MFFSSLKEKTWVGLMYNTINKQIRATSADGQVIASLLTILCVVPSNYIKGFVSMATQTHLICGCCTMIIRYLGVKGEVKKAGMLSTFGVIGVRIRRRILRITGNMCK